MPKEIITTTKIALFEGKEIRKTIYNNEWWFVVEDIILALTDTSNVKDYLYYTTFKLEYTMLNY